MFYASHFVHDYDKSYFRYTEVLSEDFTVTVNGEDVPVYTCRISRYPMNRVCAGTQRPGNQSECASFVNLVADEALTLTVTPHRAYSRVMLKPYAREIPVTDDDGTLTFTLPRAGQFVLETDSYHRCLYIFVSAPIPAPDPSSVTHFFGPGIHFPGKISLCDGDSVYIDRDALVFGCLFAEGAKDIRIFGNGLLDDRGEGRIDNGCYEPYTNGNLKFYDCHGVHIEGILCRDSAIWCLNLFGCTDVTVNDVKIFGQWRYNTDGIDIVNCRGVTVTNSFIHSFDDTVTVKGIDRFAHIDNEDITVAHCVLWCDWGRACEIGIETACRRYRDITFRECDILRGGHFVLDIQNGDCAEISDILFENIRVDYNDFDTSAQYQDTDDTVYTGGDSLQIPTLICVVNHPFRTKENCAMWNIPEELLADIDLTDIQSGGVHDVVFRDIRVHCDDAVPLTEAPMILLRSSRPGVRFSDIRVENILLNGTRMHADEIPHDVHDTDRFSLA